MRSIVIIPTYNERENLEPLVTVALMADAALDILVVDDNSPDGTGAIADDLARRTGHVRVLHRPGKAGLGAAYLAGFTYALDRDYECILEMDADFSHDLTDLPRLLAPVRAGRADLVLGSRWVAGGGHARLAPPAAPHQPGGVVLCAGDRRRGGTGPDGRVQVLPPAYAGTA